MTDINNLFFELIRVAIGNQVCLSRTPKLKEWQDLYAMAKKQSLVGICFAGVQKLQAQRQAPNSWGNEHGEMLYLQWMGMAAKIQQRNEVVNQQCVEVQKRFAEAGFRSSILKGQGVAALYDELSGLRQPGDIDIYVDCGRERAIEYAKSVQNEVEWDYKHLHLNLFKDPSTGSGQATEVEMHYVPEVLLNLRKNRKLQKWFKEHQELMFTRQGGLMVPSTEFNLFYILLHIYRHFLFEGVGLRQLMDYYFVLRQLQIVSTCSGFNGVSEIYTLLKDFGMTRFASGVMWIMKEVFGLEDLYRICAIDEEEGKYILGEVMEGGNFGHHDERLNTRIDGKLGSLVKILRHNLHLLVHYPSEVVWAPIYFVWHFAWKKFQLKSNN